MLARRSTTSKQFVGVIHLSVYKHATYAIGPLRTFIPASFFQTIILVNLLHATFASNVTHNHSTLCHRIYRTLFVLFFRPTFLHLFPSSTTKQ